MIPVEFEPKFSAGKRPQTYVLDRVATGTEKGFSFSFPNLVILSLLQGKPHFVVTNLHDHCKLFHTVPVALWSITICTSNLQAVLLLTLNLKESAVV